MANSVKSMKPWTVALCAAAAAVVVSGATAPLAAADPTPGAGSASEAIGELRTEGYDVQVNWLEGHPNVPLSECRVNDIHNPNSGPLDTTMLNTVYVDVECPNAK
jgi:hypothetical protein